MPYRPRFRTSWMASPVGHLVRARSMLSNVVYDLPRAERVHLARSDVHEKAAAFGAKIDREVFNLTVVGPVYQAHEFQQGAAGFGLQHRGTLHVRDDRSDLLDHAPQLDTLRLQDLVERVLAQGRGGD